MTKEQFEAHVRAEADVKYPVNHLIYLHAIYIAARMDHEWPLVEALQLAINHLVEPATVTLEYIPPASAMRRAADAFEKREADIYTIQKAISPYITNT